MDIMDYATQAQAVQAITGLLEAHGYNPVNYDLLKIADEYKQETGGYQNIYDNISIVWAYVDDANMNERAIAPIVGASVGTVHSDKQVFNSEHLNESSPAPKSDAELLAEGWDAAIEKVMETDVIVIPDNPYRQAATLERLRGRLRHLVDETGRSYASIAEETNIDPEGLTALLTVTGQPISVEDMAEIVFVCDPSPSWADGLTA